MSDYWGTPWSDNPYAPRISYGLYFNEKTSFAGTAIGAILYGVVISLFFQCIHTLLDPANRTRREVKWGLVVHTVTMFSLVTAYNAFGITIELLSYVDNREFPGTDVIPPGPMGYQSLILHKPISLIPTAMNLLNNCLADGLLLYRCYVIYSMSYWAIAFPSLMYLASFGAGIGLMYQTTRPINNFSIYLSIIGFGIPYYSIALSLNVLLTLMIVTRLILHRRTVREAMSVPAGTGSSYTSVIVMLVESCALYTVSLLLFIVLWGSNSAISAVFFPMLPQAQVIGPFLIVLRVANQNASRSKSISYGTSASIRFRTHGGSVSENATLPDRYSMGPINMDGKIPIELGISVETTVDLRHDD